MDNNFKIFQVGKAVLLENSNLESIQPQIVSKGLKKIKKFNLIRLG